MVPSPRAGLTKADLEDAYAPAGQVRVVVRKDFINAEPGVFDVDHGATLAELVELYLPSGNDTMVVRVNGVQVKAEDWDDTVPPDRSLVQVSDQPKGVISAIFSSLATAIFSGLGGPALAAGGSTGAASVVAGVAIVGAAAITAGLVVGVSYGVQLAVNAIFGPGDHRDTNRGPDSPSIAGTGNRVNPWGVFTKSYGRGRLWPELGSHQYTTVRGGNLVLYSVFDCGYGPAYIDPSTFKVDEQPFADLPGAEYEIRSGWPSDTPITLFPSTVHTERLGRTLWDDKEGHPVLQQEASTQANCDRAELTIVYPGGLFWTDDRGSVREDFQRISVSYRDESGSPGPWIGVDMDWVTLEAPAGYKSPDSSFVVAGERRGQFFVGVHIDFTAAGGPGRGTYGIQLSVPRGSAGIGLNSTSTSVWTELKTFTNEDPMAEPKGIAKIAIAVRASDVLGDALDGFNYVHEAILPYHDGTNWVDPDEGDDESNNWAAYRTHRAAWAMADVLRGYDYDGTGQRKGLLDIDTVDDSGIDGPAFKAFADHEAAQGYSFHGKVDYSINLNDLERNIAAASLGSFVQKGAKLSVIYDHDRTAESPVGFLNPTVCKEFSYRGRITYPNAPHAIRLSWIDPANDQFGDATEVVFRDGYNADGSGGNTMATVYEDMRAWGVQDHDQAVDFAKHKLGYGIYRNFEHIVETDIEFLNHNVGNLLLLGYDIPGISVADGRIHEVRNSAGTVIRGDEGGEDIKTLVLDRDVAFDSGETYVIDAYNELGEVLETRAINTPGDVTTDELVLTSAMATSAAGRPRTGNRLSVRLSTRKAERTIVKSVTYSDVVGGAMGAVVELERDVSEEIFSDELPNTRPIYDPNNTAPNVAAPAKPTIYGVVDRADSIQVTVGPGSDGAVQPRHIEVQFRVMLPDESLHTAQGAWSAPFRAQPHAISDVFLAPAVSGQYYGIRARAVGGPGLRGSAWVYEDIHHYTPADDPEVEVANLEWTGQGGSTVLHGNDHELTWRLTLSANDTISDPLQLNERFDDRLGQFVTYFAVSVFDSDTGELLREDQTSSQSYTYSYEKNLADGGPHRNLLVTVAAVQGNRRGRERRIYGEQPAPTLPAATLREDKGTLYGSFVRTDTDRENVKIRVWAKIRDVSNPLLLVDNEIIYEGEALNFSYPMVRLTEYEIRYAAVDRYSRSANDLIVSASTYLTSSGVQPSEISVGGHHVITTDPNFQLDWNAHNTGIGSHVDDHAILEQRYQVNRTNPDIDNYDVRTWSISDLNDIALSPNYGSAALRYSDAVIGTNDPDFVTMRMPASEGDVFFGRLVAAKSSATDVDRLTMQIRFLDENFGNVNVGVDANITPPTLAWQTYEYVTVPADPGVAFVEARLRIRGTAQDDYYFDHWLVHRQTAEEFIRDLAVTNAKIQNLDGGKVDVETLRSDSIVVGDLRVDRIVPGSRDGNLIQDPGFENIPITDWYTVDGGGTWSIGTSEVRAGMQAMEYDADGQTSDAMLLANSPDPTTMEGHAAAFEGQSFAVEFYHKYSNTDPVTAYVNPVIQFYEADGTLITTGYSQSPVSPFESESTWEPATHEAVAPADTAYVVFGIEVENGAASTVHFHFDTLFANRMVQTSHIVEDAVTSFDEDTATGPLDTAGVNPVPGTSAIVVLATTTFPSGGGVVTGIAEYQAGAYVIGGTVSGAVDIWVRRKSDGAQVSFRSSDAFSGVTGPLEVTLNAYAFPFVDTSPDAIGSDSEYELVMQLTQTSGPINNSVGRARFVELFHINHKR